MPLPPRPFHSLSDIANRWSVLPIDIVGWATEGLLALSVAAPPVKTASSRSCAISPKSPATTCCRCFGPMEPNWNGSASGASECTARPNGNGSANRPKGS